MSLTHCEVEVVPAPIPWQRQPSSLVYQCIPGGFVTGITTQLAVFKKFAGGRIENQET